MHLFLTLLLNVIVLIFPYIIPLLKLNDCAWRRDITLKALINKYDDAENLLWFTLSWQLVSVVISVLSLVMPVFIIRENIGSLIDALFKFSIWLIVSEIIFGLPFIWVDTNKTANYINSDSDNLHNQPIKF